jgi:hypothetical protein
LEPRHVSIWRRVGIAGALALPVLCSADSLTFGKDALLFFAYNWLYMAAPYGVAFLAHAAVPGVRRSTFLTPALLAVSGVLIYFEVWIRWFVPGGEGPLVWILYPPACAAVLLLVGVATLVHARLRAQPS